MPGRLIGQTEDGEGRAPLAGAADPRAAHPSGEATSNICTNQGLLAMRATMYVTAMGPQGLREVAEQCWHSAHYLAKKIAAIPGFSLRYQGEFFHEFVVKCPGPVTRSSSTARSTASSRASRSTRRLGRPGAGRTPDRRHREAARARNSTRSRSACPEAPRLIHPPLPRPPRVHADMTTMQPNTRPVSIDLHGADGRRSAPRPSRRPGANAPPSRSIFEKSAPGAARSTCRNSTSTRRPSPPDRRSDPDLPELGNSRSSGTTRTSRSGTSASTGSSTRSARAR